MRGNVISDRRIIEVDEQYVTIRFKDYKAPPIRELFVGRARLTSLECGVLEAFVEEELAKHKHTSGIPPPVAEQRSASELNHVA